MMKKKGKLLVCLYDFRKKKKMKKVGIFLSDLFLNLCLSEPLAAQQLLVWCLYSVVSRLNNEAKG
jgi:hypothetical protein